jgi:hypothetical protein
MEFQINMETKRVVGMSIASPKIWRPNPKIDNTPETEMEYRKRTQSKMSVNTNAPKYLAPPPH